MENHSIRLLKLPPPFVALALLLALAACNSGMARDKTEPAFRKWLLSVCSISVLH